MCPVSCFHLHHAQWPHPVLPVPGSCLPVFICRWWTERRSLQELLFLPAVCEVHVMSSYFYAFIFDKSITLICPQIRLCLSSLSSLTTGNILDLCYFATFRLHWYMCLTYVARTNGCIALLCKEAGIKCTVSIAMSMCFSWSSTSYGIPVQTFFTCFTVTVQQVDYQSVLILK